MSKTVPNFANRPCPKNWYYRRRVPADLADILEKNVIWSSLRTPCKKKALRRISDVAAKVEREFDEAQRRRNAQSVEGIEGTGPMATAERGLSLPVRAGLGGDKDEITAAETAALAEMLATCP